MNRFYRVKIWNVVLFEIYLLLLSFWSFSQEEYDFMPCRVWVIVHDTVAISTIKNSSLEVNNIHRPFHFAKNPTLRRLYEIESCLSEDSLFDILTNMNYDNKLFLSIEKIRTAKMLSTDPIDPMWLSTKRGESDSLWYLMKIDAPGAWAITRGDPNLRVALVDNGIDLTHPDLLGKVDPPGNFYDTLNKPPFRKHGTATATVLAGETVSWGAGKPNGRMASIGYNTKIMFNTSHGLSPLIPCLYASTVLGAKVLSISWYYGDYSCFSQNVSRKIFDFSKNINSTNETMPRPISDLLIEQEILNNGTTIIRSAGNGGHQCNGGPLHPFSGADDPRVIVVSTTTKRDSHKDDNGYSCSHYPEVDICAPGYSIIAGDTTYNQGANPAPYYYTLATSIATPIVAGVVALMHAVNPCLTPAWTEAILKKTTDPIVDAAEFPNGVGAGRINAHKAVKTALQEYNQPTDLYIRDRWDDFGDEFSPYNIQQDWNNSPDIWIRNKPDGRINQEDQQITPSANDELYVYVRIHNRSANTSVGNELLRLYWAKAKSSLTLRDREHEILQDYEFIGEMSVGKIKPCKDSIFQFVWKINNWNEINNWEVSICAIIDENTRNTKKFSVKKPEKYVVYNNNVAIKNSKTINYKTQKQHEKTFLLYNHYKKTRRFDVVFVADSNAFSHEFVKKDFVELTFDKLSWSIFKKHCVKNSQIEIIGRRQVRFLVDSISFLGVRLPPKTDVAIRLKFDFSQHKMPQNSRSLYHVRQYLVADQRLIGGYHYLMVN